MAWHLDGTGRGARTRNGEPCGLEWSDQALDAGTVRFRQALIIVDPTILLDTSSVGDGDNGGVSGRRKELAVGR